ncbi:MAG: DNA starvation/stationary phase protection protein [Thalassobaculum sp.]|uniref:Dps family protein n=1 Tax=Thalassobaculum sp. TaxID=2022740 RepID=UPI0032EEAC67
MTRNTDPVVKALEQALADTFALALKTQTYHWNVVGPNFYGLHNLFEEQYTDGFAAVDELAERIRALDAPAPGGLAAFKEIAQIADPKNGIDAKGMIDDLIDSNETISKSLKAGVETAEENGDPSTADMLTARVTVHDKATWMLRSLRG